jgi:hypothetical protein
VWYHNISSKSELERILRDASGKTHRFSLGVGNIRPEIRDEQRNIAANTLTPPLNEIFQKIEQPFIQAVTDNLATKAVFMNGKVIIVGDALAGLRPHTTGGASQGALHALLLKKVFENEMSLEYWEEKVLGWANMAHKIGVDFGALSQSDNHPQAQHDEPVKL